MPARNSNLSQLPAAAVHLELGHTLDRRAKAEGRHGRARGVISS